MNSKSSSLGELSLRTVLILTIAIFVAFLAVTMVSASTIADDSNESEPIVEVNGLYYKLYSDQNAEGKHAEVVASYLEPYSGDIKIPATVEYNKGTYNVTSIGSNAFRNCTGLKSIDLNEVTNIGNQAFYGCTGLKSIDLNEVTNIGSGAFQDCTGLTSVDLKNETSIGSNAFRNCTGLTSIDLKNVTSIGSGAFNGCTGLTKFEIDPNNTTYRVIGDVLFSGNTLTQYPLGKSGGYTVPNGVTSIGRYAFYSCTGLTSVNLNNVESIGDDAFEYCTGLTSIDLKNVTSIGIRAFQDCTGLTSVDLKNETSIGRHAFQNCTGLKSIDLKNVTSIGNGAFGYCTGLTKFEIDPNNTNYKVTGGVLFNGTTLIQYPLGKSGAYIVPDGVNKFEENAFCGCTGLTSININKVTDVGTITFFGCTGLTKFEKNPENTTYNVIDDVLFSGNGKTLIKYPLGKSGAYIVPDEVESIDNYAFYGCTGLTSVDLKDVTSIGNGAFSSCTGLTSVDLKNENISIGQGAFGGCTGLTSVELKNVTSINDSAFENCTGLTSVELKNVTSIAMSAFNGCTGLTKFEMDTGNDYYKVIDDVLFSGNGETLIKYPLGKSGAYIVPDKVKSIGEGAFEYCTGLTSVELKDVTSVGRNAFNGCTGLTSIDIKNFMNVGRSAFYGCTGLTSVDLKNVTDIGNSAFGGCTNLTSVTLPATPTSGTNVFVGCPNEITMIVPSASFDAYIAKAEWQPYANHIFVSITEATLSEIADQTYCGEQIKPTVTVTLGSTPLVLGTDYTVTYGDNKDAGVDAGEVTIDGIGKYRGCLETTFNITPKVVSLNWNDIEDLTYSGTEKVPTVTVGNTVKSEKVTAEIELNEGDNVNVGTFTFKATKLDNNNYKLPSAVVSKEYTIVPKTVTVSGMTASGKVYDGNTNATLDYTKVVIKDKVETDELTVKATGTFADANAGKGKTVDITDLELEGAKAANYTLSTACQKETKADITPKEVKVGGITASGKVYDRKTDATLDVSKATFEGLVGTETLTVTATGAFADANAGKDKVVKITKITLVGDTASNYVLGKDSQKSTTADITAKEVTVSGITVLDKEYDGKTDATLDVSKAAFEGIVTGDVLTVIATGVFEDANIGKDKTVYITIVALDGESKNNYVLASEGQQTTAKGTINENEKSFWDTPGNIAGVVILAAFILLLLALVVNYNVKKN